MTILLALITVHNTDLSHVFTTLCVDELFQFIQSTLTVELERESYGKSGHGKKGSTMDRPNTLREGNTSRQGGKCCGN